MEKKGKDIYITSKARQLLKLVPEDLKKPELTASWELKLGKIARGELKQEAFLSSIRGYTEELISEIKTADGTFRHENITGKKCPRCGKYLLAVNGKNSKLLGLPGPGMRLSGDTFPHHQCPLSELSQEAGNDRKRRGRNLYLFHLRL